MNTLRQLRKWISIIVLALVSAGTYTLDDTGKISTTDKHTRHRGN